MAIQGIDPNGSSTLVLTTAGAKTTETPAQKHAEAQAELRAGINDGDETPGLGANVNKLA